MSDWVDDLDHHDPGWVADPFPLWAAMRRRCDVARSGRYGGMFFPLRRADIRRVAMDYATFSSRYVDVRDNQVLPPDFAPPLTTDPPQHTVARAMLSHAFSPARLSVLGAEMDALCRRLLAEVKIPSRIDAVERYARPAAAGMVALLLDLGIDTVIAFQGWNIAQRFAFLRTLIDDRRRSPGTDLVSDLVRVDPRPRDDRSVLGSVFLVLVAGVDTTSAVIAGALRHLALETRDQSMLRDDGERIAPATEEFLRVLAPVTSARVVVRDTDIAGCPVQAGAMVLLSFAAANRDPRAFSDPDALAIDRAPNHHVAFGMGVHHCLGAKLARQTIRIALQHWLATVPAFRLAPHASLSWTAGSVRGLRDLPLDLAHAR